MAKAWVVVVNVVVIVLVVVTVAVLVVVVMEVIYVKNALFTCLYKFSVVFQKVTYL